MKTHIKNPFLLPAPIAALGLMMSGRMFGRSDFSSSLVFRWLFSLIVLCGTIFNPITAYSGSWQAGPSLLTARDQFAGGVLNGNIIVFGGNGNPNGINLNSTEVLNPFLGSWGYKAENNDNGGQGVEEVSGAVVNGSFYVFGAYGGGNPYGVFNFVENYNPTNNTWKSLAPMPTTRSGATAVAYNNKIYVFGGYYGNDLGVRTNYNVVEAYDPASNTWATETYMPTNLGLNNAYGISSTIAVVGNNAYVIGGYTSSASQISLVSFVSVYNFLTHAWSTNGYAPFPNPRAAFPYSSAAPVKDGKIYVIGGSTGTSLTNIWSSSRVDIYDTVSNTWTSADPLPIPYGTGEFSTVVSNNLWVVGGDSPNLANTEIASVWMYSLTNTVTTAFAYATNNGAITITEYTGSGVEVTIPSTINSLPVTSIKDHAFANCLTLTSVTIPNSVTNIGNNEFYNCPSLMGVYCQGNASTPTNDLSVFSGDNNVTVYYLPGTTGWVSTFDGHPTVLWNPQPQTSGASFGVRTNRFGFNISGSSNLLIVVEGCTNLANPVWSPLSTNTLNTFIGTNGTSYFSDPQWTNYPGRFYRLRSP